MISGGEWIAWLASAWLLGFVGSGHCLGMCGGIASALGISTAPASRHGTSRWVLVQSLGRVSTYAALGALFGAVGSLASSMLGVGPVLRLVAGALIVVFGTQLLGLRLGADRIERLGLAVWRKLSPITRRIGAPHSARGAFFFGAVWGLLPCGLVYSAAAAATATGGVASGALFMLSFGLGTLPAMVFAGVGGGAMMRGTRMRRVAGAIMVVLGIASILAALPADPGVAASHGGARGMHGAPIEADATQCHGDAP